MQYKPNPTWYSAGGRPAERSFHPAYTIAPELWRQECRPRFPSVPGWPPALSSWRCCAVGISVVMHHQEPTPSAVSQQKTMSVATSCCVCACVRACVCVCVLFLGGGLRAAQRVGSVDWEHSLSKVKHDRAWSLNGWLTVKWSQAQSSVVTKWMANG